MVEVDCLDKCQVLQKLRMLYEDRGKFAAWKSRIESQNALKLDMEKSVWLNGRKVVYYDLFSACMNMV